MAGFFGGAGLAALFSAIWIEDCDWQTGLGFAGAFSVAVSTFLLDTLLACRSMQNDLLASGE